MARRKSTPMPEDWAPRQKDVDKFKSEFPMIDVDAFTENFMDAAQQYEYADWNAAYRTWFRTDVKRGSSFTYSEDVLIARGLAQELGYDLPSGWEKDAYKYARHLEYRKKQGQSNPENQQNVASMVSRLVDAKNAKNG